MSDSGGTPCACMAYQDQIPLYARSGRVPKERFIPWRFCPWCGRSPGLTPTPSASQPAPAEDSGKQPSPEQRFGEDEVKWEVYATQECEQVRFGPYATERLAHMAARMFREALVVRAVTTRSVVSPPADTGKPLAPHPEGAPRGS